MKKKIIATVTTLCVLFLVTVVILGSVISSLAAVLSGGGEEEQNNTDNEFVYENSPLSPTVLALKDEIEKELKKYGKEKYVTLSWHLYSRNQEETEKTYFNVPKALEKPQTQ